MERLYRALFRHISLSNLLVTACVLLWLLKGLPLEAHPFGGVYQKTYVYPMGSFILVEYHTHIGRDILLTMNADSDRDRKLSPSEKKKLTSRLADTLVPNLSVLINETPAHLIEMGRELAPENPADLFEGVNFILTFRLPLSREARNGFVFRFHDHNFLAGELDRLSYFHGVMGPSSGSRLLEDGRGLEIRWGHAIPAEPDPGTPAIRDNSRKDNLPVPLSETDILSEYFARGRTGPGVYLAAIIGAFALGAAHALSPGHGKAMVAAYLVGSKGRIVHAFWLGIIVTFTHVATVILLGGITLILSEYFLPQDLFPWLGGISGVIIFLIGYWMLARRFFQHSLHTHDHHHHHHHDHEPESPYGISIKGIFSMGIAGGMVPCPSALVVLLVSLSFHRVAEGIGLIFFFSLGLAAVLIFIGILTVTASRFADKFSGSRTWLLRLPALSAGFIMLFGIAIIFNSFLSAGILQINWTN